MTAPKPKQVYDDPDAYWDFVTVTTDATFEGQHFDRKEAGRPEADGTTHNSKLGGVRNQIEECVSAFANATGGLLVLGISSNGAVAGLRHLNESQLNSMLRFDRLVHHGCQVRLHDIVNLQGVPNGVALFLVPAGDGPICETVQTPARAWIRQGPQNIPLSDAARDRLKRDRRVVDFERAACTRFDTREIDAGVLKEFKDSYLSVVLPLGGLCCNLLCGAHEGVVGSAGPSCRFEFEVRVDELDCFGKGRGSKAEGAFDNAGFAGNVIRDVEG
jgi:hypothetical protein